MPYSLLKYSLYCCILIYSLILNAQQPSFRQYTVRDGLPSNSVYDLLQDQKGYLWFATDVGVSRFDGKNFVNFTESDGLHENGIFEIEEDSKGRVWLWGLKPQISYYKDGKITQLPAFKDIVRRISYVIEDNKGDFYLGTPGNNDSGRIIHLDSNLVINEIFNCPGNSLVEYNDTIWATGKEILSIANGQTNRSTWNIDNVTYTDFVWIEDELYYYGSNGKVRRFDNQQVVFDLSDHIKPANDYRIYLINKNELWVASEHTGIYKCQTKNLKITNCTNYLKNVSVNKVIKDNENNYWFSTVNEGIFCLPSSLFLSHTTDSGLSDNRITTIHQVDNGSIFLGLHNGAVDAIDLDNTTIHNNLISKHDYSLTTILETTNKDIIFGSLYSIVHTDKNLNIKKKLNNKSLVLKTLYYDSNHNLWFGNIIGFTHYHSEEIKHKKKVFFK